LFNTDFVTFRYTLETDTWEKLPLEAIVLQSSYFAKNLVQLDRTFLLGSVDTFLIYDTTHGTFNDTGIAAPKSAYDVRFVVLDQLPDYCKMPS
jgi:hypothetical protein